MEKLVLALVSASKRQKRYFQAHTVIVITNQLIKQMLSNPELTGRLLKWSYELEEHDIQYRPRTSVKGQILTDFIVERPEDNSEDTLMEDEEELPDPWTLFDATNNEAEYEALIAGLKIVEQMGVQNLQANVDSRLVANQVNETYVAKENDMIRYLEKVKMLTGSFKVFDDASRFCYVYLLHTKDEALDKFKVFKTEVELQQGSLIKRFRTDKGGLSQGFWGEAMTVVRLPDQKLKTLGEKSIEWHLVGYAEHSKAFRFYVIERNDSVSINSIIELRDVIFGGVASCDGCAC
ncbi:reverse transcriptase domain-containing protein [Tanacetum coccineum]|uniref:Reverse transcriptase domain-containing protein n=1 Tax=Tanacetum coccineum TaxID=301880 RepID=A0ABQ4X7N3_9ASTR